MTASPEMWWSVDFVPGVGAGDDDVAGFVRLALVDGRCWYWCYLVGADVGLVAVRDHDVAPPRRPDVLEIRADALWAELVCETPGEHWGVGLEAFGLRLDAPVDAWTTEIGERVAVGLDLEWEIDDVGAPQGIVHGDVLVERDRFTLDGWGALEHAVAGDARWPTDWAGWCRFPDGRSAQVAGGRGGAGPAGIDVPEEVRLGDGRGARCTPRAVVPVPLESEPGAKRGPALVRVLTDVVPDGESPDGEPDASATGTGWVEVLQS